MIGAIAGAAPELATTPRAVLYEEAESRLYRFAPPGAEAESGRPAVLIVPSLINRWYVVDLRPGASLVAGLLERGLDVYCLDWGAAGDEDRDTSWDDLMRRLARAVRRSLAAAGRRSLAVVGYCMGGTLAAIQTALEPAPVAALVDLLGPIDFAAGGQLARAVDARWFDVEAIAGAGNVTPVQMQSGFSMLRPTGQVAKWIGLIDRIDDEKHREAFAALETWASDNIPFPAAAYRTYIGQLYQENALIRGEHVALGRRVSLDHIRCPVLCVVAERDTICPPAAATALLDRVGSVDRTLLTIQGGHVGAVVGSRAPRELYAPLADWLLQRLA
ncbi:MAG TPA: alpha/beta fold hydrolase [Kofleriaceae bacterium]|nr:alpha/beta fold hydrolase [Kofleriaceae bacterium]